MATYTEHQQRQLDIASGESMDDYATAKVRQQFQSVEAKRSYLEACGFKIGPRDPRGINTNYPGAFMVAEDYEADELPTEDGSNGPWCIVGDNLDDMIAQAFDVWFDDYEEAKNLAAAIKVAS